MKRFASLLMVLLMVSALVCVPVTHVFALEPDPPGPVESAPTEPATTQPPTESTTPSTEPTTPSTEPTTPSTEPTTPSTEPTTPSTEPTAPSTEPTTPSTEPTTPSTEPTTPSTEPTTPSTEPTVPPTTPSTEPSVGIPVVTKDPTGETVNEGGYAEFVARANYCEKIIWHLMSPGGGTDILAQDAPSRFGGLVVTGLGTERLGLNNIPKDLNEWRVRAEFIGRDGNAWSASAIINVMNQELKAPTITEQPKGATLKANEATVLKVGASASEAGATLTYQWYRNTANSNIGGKAILGATGATFTPDYISGTTYYYCAVRTSSGNEISAATKTQCAAVVYEAVAETTAPTTEPTTEATTEPVTETTEVTEPEETQPVVTPKRSNTLLIIVVVVIIAIAVLGIVATVLILKFYPRDDGDDDDDTHFDDDYRDEPPAAPIGKPADDEWDDLSDLGDLNFYLDDDQ